MRNLRFFLFGLVLVLTKFTIFAQDEITNTEITNIKDETEKWQCIEKYFASNLNASKVPQKLGHFLDSYSSYMAALTIEIFKRIDLQGKTKELAHQLFGEDQYDRDQEVWSSDETQRKPLENFICQIAPIIGFLITNKILKAIGKWLENKDGRCLHSLTDFVNNWKENKEQTPASLIPMFEKLATENSISKVDKTLAKKIVETIIATSLMINSVK